MKVAYFDCFSGVSGDMILGAIIDAGLPFADLKSELETLDLSGYSLSAGKIVKGGVTAHKLDVTLDAPSKRPHRHYPDIVKIIEASRLDLSIKEKALLTFQIIAEAESKIHGVPIEKVHFHEVGAVDSIVDIVGAAIGLVRLNIGKVYSSSVNVGSGEVLTEHGVLPVPAPATAEILKGVPTYASGPAKELATPTGAAILKANAISFGPSPLMIAESTGYGAGGYDLADRPNVLRLTIGEAPSNNGMEESLVELRTDIDDMNPERFPVVRGLLFDSAALDVTFTATQMKKGRPGVTVTVLCEPHNSTQLETILFCHTTTLGIKRYKVGRVSLRRRMGKVTTRFGSVDVKIAELPDGGTRAVPEFESVLAQAKRSGVSFGEVYNAAISISVLKENNSDD